MIELIITGKKIEDARNLMSKAVDALKEKPYYPEINKMTAELGAENEITVRTRRHSVSDIIGALKGCCQNIKIEVPQTRQEETCTK